MCLPSCMTMAVAQRPRLKYTTWWWHLVVITINERIFHILQFHFISSDIVCRCGTEISHRGMPVSISLDNFADVPDGNRIAHRCEAIAIHNASVYAWTRNTRERIETLVTFAAGAVATYHHCHCCCVWNDSKLCMAIPSIETPVRCSFAGNDKNWNLLQQQMLRNEAVKVSIFHLWMRFGCNVSSLWLAFFAFFPF